MSNSLFNLPIYILLVCVDRGCAAGVGDIFGDCDSDSDDCESVVSDTELKDIYGSEEPQAKRQRSLSKSMMTHQKKSGVFVIPVFRKTERKKTPLVTLRTFNPGGGSKGGSD